MSRLTALLGMLVMSVAVLAATWPIVAPEMQWLIDTVLLFIGR